MKTKKQKLGNRGENLATEFLLEKGYTIVGRNFRFGHHELDIIAEKNGTLMVIEVKSVHQQEFGTGESRILNKKQQSIIKAAYAYLDQNERYQNRPVRFDVICINFQYYPARIIHYEGAFWQSW